MYKTILAIITLLIIFGVGVGGYYYYTKQVSKSETTEKTVHFHAGFQVYKEGALVDFSGLRYMHEKPCTTDGSESEKHEDEQIEKAHLHDRVGDVVHVHKEHVKWSDLFNNLKYSVEPQKVEGYLNGKQINNILDKEIKPYDSLVLFIGEHVDVQSYLSKAVTKANMQEAEKKSENCGS